MTAIPSPTGGEFRVGGQSPPKPGPPARSKQHSPVDATHEISSRPGPAVVLPDGEGVSVATNSDCNVAGCGLTMVVAAIRTGGFDAMPAGGSFGGKPAQDS
jgi:hypothetical protein